MISERSIEEVRRRANIVEVIGEVVNLKKMGQIRRGLCPFHHEKDPSFTVYQDKQIYKCFGCQKGGNVFSFLMDYHNLGFPEAVISLAERYGIEIQVSEKYKQEREKRKTILDALICAQNFFKRKLKGSSAEEYALSRGLAPETIEYFQLGYAPNSWGALTRELLERNHFQESVAVEAGLIIRKEKGDFYDRFRNRLIIPLYNIKGELIGFTSRSLDNSEPKYINSPETPVFKKGENLFGIHEAEKEIRRSGEIVIIEGQLDRIMSRQAGHRNFVEAGGTAFTEKQAEIIKRKFPNAKIILAYDNDEGGIKAAIRNGKILIPTTSSYICAWSQGKDPAQIIQEGGDLNSDLKKSKPFVDFYIEHTLSQFEMDTFESRRGFLENIAKELYGEVPDGLKGLLVQRVAEKFVDKTTETRILAEKEKSKIREEVIDYFENRNPEDAQDKNIAYWETKFLGEIWSLGGEYVKKFIGRYPNFKINQLSKNAQIFLRYIMESENGDVLLESPLFEDKHREEILNRMSQIAWDEKKQVNIKDLEEFFNKVYEHRKTNPPLEEIEHSFLRWAVKKIGNLERLVNRAELGGKSAQNIFEIISETKEKLGKPS